MYLYYYFAVKKDRNLFVDKIENDETLAEAGIVVVNIANDVSMASGQGFVSVICVPSQQRSLKNVIGEHFDRFESHRECVENGSPYDY